jgi:hypothetical protein
MPTLGAAVGRGKWVPLARVEVELSLMPLVLQPGIVITVR